jgi:threonine/homoserine/homoserine lactone efflux protein
MLKQVQHDVEKIGERMTLLQSLIAFAIAGGLLTITPGVDTLMVLRTAAVEGPRRATLAALGIGSGLIVWGGAVALGMGALMATEPMLFLAAKWTGALYLGWLGLGLLLRPRDRLDGTPAVRQAHSGSALRWYRRGLVTNLLNPKIGIFYLSFLPQFVPAGFAPGPFIFLLASLHILMGLAWFAGLIAATVPLGRVLARPVVVRRMDRACGALFMGFGLRLALAR